MHRPCMRRPYDPKASELLSDTDAVDVVAKAMVARAGQTANPTEDGVAEPAPPAAETRAGSFSNPPGQQYPLRIETTA